MKPLLGFQINYRKAGLGLAVFALMGLGVFFLQKKENPAPLATSPVLLLREDQIKKLNQDEDGDGLKDWEEAIFRTDKANPDTDGDGTNDGEEVNKGRDPLVPGPNDFITPKQEAKKSALSAPNITNDFAEKFLRAPLAQIISGGQPTVDPSAVEAYTERLLNRSVLASAPQITGGEIKTGVNDAPEAIQEYFHSFSAIFLSLKARGKNEIDVVTQAFQSQEYEPLANLAAYDTAYEKAVLQLKTLAAPPSLKEFHVSIINYLLKFKLSVAMIKNAESDPIQAMLAINERLKLNDEFNAYLQKSAAIFAVNIQQYGKKQP